MRRKLSNKGETIVEVLIAIAILSAALGGAFAVSSRSQKTVQSNQERYQAQLIANQQADLLKLAQADDGKKAKINSYTNSSRVFCVDSANGNIMPLTDKTPISLLDAACRYDATSTKGASVANTRYQVLIQPIQSAGPGPGNPVDTFVITVEWDGLNGNVESVRLLYGV